LRENWNSKNTANGVGLPQNTQKPKDNKTPPEGGVL
jgi:hypothetical protein